eukprot:gene10716-biopygen4675
MRAAAATIISGCACAAQSAVKPREGAMSNRALVAVPPQRAGLPGEKRHRARRVAQSVPCGAVLHRARREAVPCDAVWRRVTPCGAV